MARFREPTVAVARRRPRRMADRSSQCQRPRRSDTARIVSSTKRLVRSRTSGRAITPSGRGFGCGWRLSLWRRDILLPPVHNGCFAAEHVHLGVVPVVEQLVRTRWHLEQHGSQLPLAGNLLLADDSPTDRTGSGVDRLHQSAPGSGAAKHYQGARGGCDLGRRRGWWTQQPLVTQELGEASERFADDLLDLVAGRFLGEVL